MRRKSPKIQLLMGILMLPIWLLAQTTISGKVTEAGTNLPLPGASVNERGTTNATQTDIEGKFTLKVTRANTKLVISYIGYASQTVDARNDIQIILEPDNSKLNEVVVTGLASSIKRSNMAN